MNPADLGALLHALFLFVGIVLIGSIAVKLCRLAFLYLRDKL